MKSNVKKFVSTLLAAAMLLCSFVSLGFSSADAASGDESNNILLNPDGDYEETVRTADLMQEMPGDEADGNIEETAEQTTAVSTENNGILVGDVDFNASVEILDATIIQKKLGFLLDLSEKALLAADCNGDGELSIIDATFIQYAVSGLKYEGSRVGEYIQFAEPTTQATEEPTIAEPTTIVPTTSVPVPATTEKPAPSVGKVKNLGKTTFEKDRVGLSWDKVAGASGYAVYYRNADKTANYTKFKDVTTNSITVTGLENTSSYYFRVAAYIIQDGKRYDGPAAEKKTATQAAPVTGLHLSRSSSVIEFKWNKVARATGYKVYRACAKSNWKYVEYELKGNSNTTYSEKNAESGKEYRYIVKAYRVLYGDCYYHSTGSTLKTIGGLCASNVKVETQVSKVTLWWYKHAVATSFDIYYTKNPKNGYTKLGTTTNSFYNTPRLANNTTYYFQVRPCKKAGNTTFVGTYNTYNVKVTDKAFGKSVGKTYIEVSILEQKMWCYVDGKEYCSTYVVTGNDDGYHNTPKGAHKIWQRQSPSVLNGPGYSTPVDFWLAFTSSGCGIHDSTWRSSKEYGGTTYKGNGSHGCVNTPYSVVKKIYQKSYIGEYVVVH